MFDSPLSRFRAGHIECGLQERVVAARSTAAQHDWFVFYLDSGQAVAETQDGEFEMSGPAMRWGPLDEHTRLRIGAGGAGYYLFFGTPIFEDAIGLAAEGPDLRMFAAQHLVATFERSDSLGQRLDALFGRITAEATTPQFGSEIAVSAYIRLLLVLFWRSVDRDVTPQSARRQGIGDINRFRNLVEAHFRARWSAQHYAEAMGITYDRLHDLCVRTVGKPPARLIRERSIHEARVLLQRTALSAERIAVMLGFSSSSQFNHVFKSMTGETPGAFRKQALAQAGTAESRASGFADWP
ncbi:MULTISPECIES: AraC family transcriptional regulator [Maritimibacter]|uniref:4-hydroxyphenylacetate catabolism regulatory protein HpaA n=1 Tax=Maritimibacter alkaliphilus HTCC2654 TaxID=314271 RepID=A3VIK6_9RHOB|nr:MULTISPECIES: AraC family transcriptional regulator [Maritimibacter]EAQ11937.1 4-hydroxyphenylacetate catabolism regulatory protein HpaA [Rhodobacterales bacterium HTCC2654] [Maritimibacter alkaliphilus HTCC2654]TYP85642.1 AraC family transcriptional regulator [Maritimibacter alkaliphilus HTCC2654]